MFGECLLFCFIILHGGSARTNDFQLPKNVIPVEYDLTIHPNLIKGIYSGKVAITVNVTETTNTVTLHSKNLEIIKASVDSKESSITTNTVYDFIILNTLKLITEGIHLIEIVFEGDMKNKTYGFFRGYEEDNEKQIYFGATFFEPINARVAFPCFDEPIFKAQFSIHVSRPPGYIALSNINQISETPGPDDSVVVHFGKTPVMSTYLVSFFVGNYTYVEDQYVKQNGEIIPTRIYSPPTKIENVKFSAHEIPKLLKWFSNYTGFDYMLPKLDYITFNSKFHIEGGMEDWGAISCREDSVFYNSNMSKLNMRAVLNIGHEFAHMWFGDLLTTSSWTEFWLNEGFARFMDNKATEIYKDWEMVTASRIITQRSAFWRDDELTVKPLSWEIENPVDAYQLLNVINYDKGGTVLRMVEDLVGEPLMNKIMQTYVQEHQYENVVSQNFIDVLQNFVDFNASDFLESFVKQPGYPLITVNQTLNKRDVVLTMKRFLRFPQVDDKMRWSVPIKYITNLNMEYQIIWFNKSQSQVTLEFSDEITWIKLNFKRGGYYRTNYPIEMWIYFSKIIKDFSVEDRVHLLDDSLALVRSGELECRVALDIMDYLSDENQFEVWEVAQNNFNIIRLALLQHDSNINYLLAYVIKLVDKPYRNNNWEVDPDETFRIKRTRSTIFNLACFYGHPDCQKRVRELWDRRNGLHIDIKNILLTNNPNRIVDYNASSHNSMEMMSTWFGADLSQLPLEPIFRWPRKIIENCDLWLKQRFYS